MHQTIFQLGRGWVLPCADLQLLWGSVKRWRREQTAHCLKLEQVRCQLQILDPWHVILVSDAGSNMGFFASEVPLVSKIV